MSGELIVSIRYLLCERFRDGQISGTYYNGCLMGEVEFVSSRGIGFKAPMGKGFALDVASSFRHGKWSTFVAVEGLLGEMHWKRMRKVSAFVDTNAFAQDPDGFVRSLPLLVGREEHLRLSRSVDKQWLVGLGYKHSRWRWVVTIEERVGKSNWHASAVWSLKPNQRFFFDLQVPVRAVSLGYLSRNFNLLVTLSHPDLSKALVLGVQVQISSR